MNFVKLPSNSYTLLKELIEAENPTECLCTKYESSKGNQQEVLRGMIRELKEAGYINVMWADNIPWHVTINNSGITYDERLAEYEKAHAPQVSNNITIGNNNKINDSVIAASVSGHVNHTKKNFYEKHPILCGIFIAVVGGAIVAIPFWDKIWTFIGGLF